MVLMQILMSLVMISYENAMSDFTENDTILLMINDWLTDTAKDEIR
jgi:hypothetical protein